VLVRRPGLLAAVLLAPAGVALLALIGGLLTNRPPFGLILYLSILVGAMTTLPGLACLVLALRQQRRSSAPW
jgi:hypothetical protein